MFFISFWFWTLSTMPQTLTTVSWPKRYYQGGSRGIYIFTQIVYHFNLKYIFRDSLLLRHIAEVPQHSCCGSPSLQPPPGQKRWHSYTGKSPKWLAPTIPHKCIYNYHQVSLLTCWTCWFCLWVSWELFVHSHHHLQHHLLLGLAQQTLMRLFTALVSGLVALRQRKCDGPAHHYGLSHRPSSTLSAPPCC